MAKWYGHDSEKNYRIMNSGRLNYSKDEIDYSMNLSGFRCDEFTEKSDFPVLFMGCSFTEGHGLPLNEVWAYHFHKRIVDTTNKNIPFWSLAKGGTSIDYAARSLYEIGISLKPKYIFYLMSGISRREYCLDSPDLKPWFPHATPLFEPTEDFKLLSKLFVDPDFAFYQTYRSSIILNLIANMLNTKIFIFGMDMDIDVAENKRIDFFKKFDRIEYVPIKDLPENFSDEEIPESIKKRPIKARDNSHPGAVWQYKLYRKMWDYLKDKISFA